MYSTTGFHSLRTWLLAGLVGVFAAACGGGNEGRDPVLGNDGNVALTPTVTATAPEDGEIGVATDIAAVTATFSEPMTALTDGASFTLTCEAPCTAPSGAVTLDAAGTIASFTLDGTLETGTRYTATVTGARSAESGLAIAGPFRWNFATIGPAPTVIGVAPANSATGVAIDTSIVAQFNEPVVALTADDFTVTCADPCSSAVGTVSRNATGTIATFSVTGSETLDAQTEYTATIVTATSSASGQVLVEPFVWRFTTGTTTDATRPRVNLTEPETTRPGSDHRGGGQHRHHRKRSANTSIRQPITDASFTLTCDEPRV
ncbi:MAG: Ig-like domain-containing protein [Gammaproteobacteria bacterium]|nr:Ig-like domain-containing protein [Gammaproteobacteria bacterium]